MNITLLKNILLASTIFLCSYPTAGQNCAGPLEILLSGSASADTLSVDLQTTGITCQAEESGNINLMVSGGNGGYQFTWLDDPLAGNFRDSLAVGNYAITVTDSEGCQEVITASIELQTPDNTGLAYTSGCGNCLLSNGSTDYFFNENNEYLASVLDVAQDNEDLGDTEVCLDWAAETGLCNGNPHLQRSWSIAPLTNNSSCLKLFFSENEFAALAAQSPLIPPLTAEELIESKGLCLTGFSGGMENCDDFLTAKTYSQLDANPLEIILEDETAGIWSVSVCVDEYATFYFHLCDYALPVNLISFYGQAGNNGNEIYWESAEEYGLAYYELQFRRDGREWKKLKKVKAENHNINKYKYQHRNPKGGLNYYRLKMVEASGEFSFSSVIAIQSQSQARKEKFSPTTFSTRILFETEIPADDIYDFIFFNDLGQIAYREKVFFKRGYQKHYFDLSRLPAGIYFAKVIAEKSRVLTSHKIIKVVK